MCPDRAGPCPPEVVCPRPDGDRDAGLNREACDERSTAAAVTGARLARPRSPAKGSDAVDVVDRLKVYVEVQHVRGRSPLPARLA